MTPERLGEIAERLRTHILSNAELTRLDDDALEDHIRGALEEQVSGEYVSVTDRVRVVQQVYGSIRGLGLLDSLLSDESVTEVMVNGPDSIFVERNGQVQEVPGSFESSRRLEDIIQRIVGQAGREVNQANPIVDTRLPDGSRVNVVLPPVALDGPTVTIRKFSRDPMTMRRLIGYGSVTPEVADFLATLVRSRYNIFISGGTGSGKTTFLNALTNFVGQDERLITIEDSAELQIDGVDNLVRLETRNANVAGVGEISMRQLIRSSLRMRPERIVVGEVRGAEALDMLQAMNTGHDGSLSTGHANSTRDMLSRLETMVLQASSTLPLEAIRHQIASALDIVIHLSRLRDHTRRTMEIAEVVGYEDGQIVLNPLYEFQEDPSSTFTHVAGALVRTDNPMLNVDKLRLAGYQDEF